MKDHGIIVTTADIKGYLSETGAYGFWYPCEDEKVIIPKGTSIEHLFLWKNQGLFLAFKMKMEVLNKDNVQKPNQYVCVWVKPEDIT